MSRSILVAVYVAVALLGGMTIAALPLLAPAGSLAGLAGIAAFTCSVLGSVTWAVLFAVLAHRRLDEYQRETAKSAVYWGTTLGIAVAAPLYAFVEIGGLHRLMPSLPVGRPLAIAFASGFGLPLVSVTLGIMITCAWLRWSKQ